MLRDLLPVILALLLGASISFNVIQTWQNKRLLEHLRHYKKLANQIPEEKKG